MSFKIRIYNNLNLPKMRKMEFIFVSKCFKCFKCFKCINFQNWMSRFQSWCWTEATIKATDADQQRRIGIYIRFSEKNASPTMLTNLFLSLKKKTFAPQVVESRNKKKYRKKSLWVCIKRVCVRMNMFVLFWVYGWNKSEGLKTVGDDLKIRTEKKNRRANVNSIKRVYKQKENDLQKHVAKNNTEIENNCRL